MSNLIQELCEYLHTESKIAYFTTDRRELNIRCPYCGDSANLNNAHLYISVEAPYSFFCQRCETKGFLNLHTLKDFDVDSPELTSRINLSAKKAIRNTTKTTKDTNTLVKGGISLRLPDYETESKLYKRKLAYLEGRWGVKLSEEDLKDLKVVFTYKQFIVLNKLQNMMKFYMDSEYNTALLKWLDFYSIGFLSTDNSYLTFRHTKIPGNGRRYYTENMHRLLPPKNGNRLYTIANEVNIMTPKLNLVLAEGALDISSIWINLYGRKKAPDTIFGAVNGKAYKLFISTLRKMGFFDISLDLYSDKEINLNSYKYSLNFNHFSSIRIHYNEFEGEKDFGVPLSRIKQKTYKLK